jgi:hypothetical protein
MAMDGKLVRVVGAALAVSLWCFCPRVLAAPDPSVGTDHKESIDERIAAIVSESPGLRNDEVDDELFTSRSMLEIVHNPRRYESDIEAYVLTRPHSKDAEVRVAVLALQCVPFKNYVRFVKRLASAGKGTINTRALPYSIVPGSEWSTRVARKYREPEVKESLTLARQSPNADAELRTLIDHVLAGEYAHPKQEPLLKCDEGR